MNINTFLHHKKLTFSFMRGSAYQFHVILSNYGERYQKERNAKYVWSAQL